LIHYHSDVIALITSEIINKQKL